MHAGAVASNMPRAVPNVNPPPSNPAFVWDRDGHKQASFDAGKDIPDSRATPNSLSDEIDTGRIRDRKDPRSSGEGGEHSRANGHDATAGKRPRSSASNISDADSSGAAPRTGIRATVTKTGSASSSAPAGVVKKKTATSTASHIYK